MRTLGLLLLLVGCLDSGPPPEHEYAPCADICTTDATCTIPREGIATVSCSCPVEGKLTPVICEP